MGMCMSAYAVVGASETAAILILCNGDAVSEGETGFVRYKQRFTAAEAVKKNVAEGQEEYCICSWEIIQVGQMMDELKPWQCLEVGEIYFLFPRRKLRFQVPFNGMSSLLLKVASALKSMPSSPLPLSYDEYDNHDRKEQVMHFRDKAGFEKEYYGMETGCPKQRKSLRSYQSPRKQSQWTSRWTSLLETIVEVA